MYLIVIIKVFFQNLNPKSRDAITYRNKAIILTSSSRKILLYFCFVQPNHSNKSRFHLFTYHPSDQDTRVLVEAQSGISSQSFQAGGYSRGWEHLRLRIHLVQPLWAKFSIFYFRSICWLKQRLLSLHLWNYFNFILLVRVWSITVVYFCLCNFFL